MTMKSVNVRRMSAFCYGLCLTVGVIGAGCLDDVSSDGSEDSILSAITVDTTASYTVVGVQSNKCVGVVDSSRSSLALLEIRTCTGNASERFRPESMGSGFFRLRNELSGLCVDVTGESTSDGAAVIQYDCHTGLNQQWSFTDVAGGAERLTARHSGKVLDVTGAVTTEGTLVEQWTSNAGTNQQFVVIKAFPAFAPDPR
jgi:hypothetical protein